MKLIRPLLGIGLLLVLVFAVVKFPGWWKGVGCSSCSFKTSGSGVVLITSNGKPYITEDDLNAYIAAQSILQPTLAEYSRAYPSVRAQVLEQFELSKLAQTWWKEYGRKHSDQRKAFEQKIAVINEVNCQNMLLKEFVEAGKEENGVLSDEDLKNYYEGSRAQLPIFQQPPFLQREASTHVQGVVFMSEQQAQDFLAKAKSSADFSALAGREKRMLTDFGMINSQSTKIDATIKSRSLSMELSSVDIIPVMSSGTKKFWVVKIVARKEAQYTPFENVKATVQQAYGQAKMMADFQERVKVLREKLKIDENPAREYLKKQVEDLQIAQKTQQEKQIQQPEVKTEHEA